MFIGLDCWPSFCLGYLGMLSIPFPALPATLTRLLISVYFPTSSSKWKEPNCVLGFSSISSSRGLSGFLLLGLLGLFWRLTYSTVGGKGRGLWCLGESLCGRRGRQDRGKGPLTSTGHFQKYLLSCQIVTCIKLSHAPMQKKRTCLNDAITACAAHCADHAQRTGSAVLSVLKGACPYLTDHKRNRKNRRMWISVLMEGKMCASQ